MKEEHYNEYIDVVVKRDKAELIDKKYEIISHTKKFMKADRYIPSQFLVYTNPKGLTFKSEYRPSKNGNDDHMTYVTRIKLGNVQLLRG